MTRLELSLCVLRFELISLCLDELNFPIAYSVLGVGLYWQLRTQAQQCGPQKSYLPYINLKHTEAHVVWPWTVLWLILVRLSLKSLPLIACVGLQVWLVPSPSLSYWLAFSRRGALNSSLMLLQHSASLHFSADCSEAFSVHPIRCICSYITPFYFCLSTFSISASLMSLKWFTVLFMHFGSFSRMKERKLHEDIAHISLVLVFTLRTKTAMLGMEKMKPERKDKAESGTEVIPELESSWG